MVERRSPKPLTWVRFLVPPHLKEPAVWLVLLNREWWIGIEPKRGSGKDGSISPCRKVLETEGFQGANGYERRSLPSTPHIKKAAPVGAACVRVFHGEGGDEKSSRILSLIDSGFMLSRTQSWGTLGYFSFA